MSDRALREQLAAVLRWEDAHASADRVAEGVPQGRWSASPPGLPYTLWQLLEHIRLAQHDILDFCRNPGYAELRWPGWEREVAALAPDRGFSIYPPLIAQGPPIGERTRGDAPIPA